jgi:hypothetical protein
MKKKEIKFFKNSNNKEEIQNGKESFMCGN